MQCHMLFFSAQWLRPKKTPRFRVRRTLIDAIALSVGSCQPIDVSDDTSLIRHGAELLKIDGARVGRGIAGVEIRRKHVSHAEHLAAKPIAQEHENDSTLSSARPHSCARSLRARSFLTSWLAQRHEVVLIACQAFPLAKESSIRLHCAQERFAAFRRIVVGCTSRSPLFTHLLLDNGSCFDHLIDTISTRLWDFHAPRARHFSNA